MVVTIQLAVLLKITSLCLIHATTCSLKKHSNCIHSVSLPFLFHLSIQFPNKVLIARPDQRRNYRRIPLNNHTRRFPHTVLQQGLRDHSARAANRAPAPQEHTGTGVSPNDELVNMNGPNAPGLGIKLGGCIHSERYYIAMF